MGPTDSRLVDAVCVVVAEQLRASNGTRPGMPNYQILTVSAVAQTIMVAFRQPNLNKHEILVWAMDFPPGGHTLCTAEAIITENFLEDMCIEGSVNWKRCRRIEVGDLSILLPPQYS